MNINPQEIHGNWRAGYALDVHTVSSHLLPSGRYETNRTELGELVYQVKYWGKRQSIAEIAGIAAKFVKDKFVVNGYLVLPYLAAIIPIPPSDINRAFQPVHESAKEMGKILDLPVCTDYLIKVKETELIKNLPDAERKRAELQGAFVVQSQDLKGRCVLLFDDIYDSGETLTQATNVLDEQGGVSRVFVLTLTQTRMKR